MSNSLQHKLYNQEVTPPTRVWEQVAAELDASHLADKFPGQLQNAEVTPPANCWEEIAVAISTPSFPQQLREMEVAPPTGAWSAIAAQLNDNITAGVPATRKTIPWIRYAAAAALVGILAFGASRFLGNKNNNELAIEQADSTNLAKNNDSPAAGVPMISDDSIRDEAPDQSEESTNVPAATAGNHPGSNRAHQALLAANLYESPASTISYSDAIRPAVTYRDLPCSDVPSSIQYASSGAIDMAGRYTLMMTSDGRIVRVSKKLGDLICCVSGEETNAECQDQLRKWRQTLADSPLAPSPGNFMDILDLVNTLQEKSL